ncbi:MAG TPA: chloride channel protein [Caulobacterales bacterium]|nr:chloride channel protein [Caulobacterales bacterium]
MTSDPLSVLNAPRRALGPALGRVGAGAMLAPAFFRRLVRTREWALTILAAFAGIAAAALVALMNAIADSAHRALFALQPGDRLSGVTLLDQPISVFWPMVGGGVLALTMWVWARVGRGEVVDPIEANAIHGGRMSFRDSAILALQTLISNGFGASVGLEAGYTQIAAGTASRAGAWLKLRREDLRVIVGCGAAGAIAAAFNGPFTGAFYAFELVLAQYAIGFVAPVMAASIAATIAMRAFGGAPFSLAIQTTHNVTAWDFPWFILLGIFCAVIGIGWMRMVPLIERGLSMARVSRFVRPIAGGALVGLLGAVNIQTLSGGHGAISTVLFSHMALDAVLIFAALKLLASAISLGAGFRGGLFFSSLLVGALIGRALALIVETFAPNIMPDETAFTLVGMGAMAAAVIGAPLTMSFLVLETTSDYALTGAVLAASITANMIVREAFGYSFSTWRFHLRGETIRSARDVGWVRALTVERLMRRDPAVAPHTLNIGEFQERFPLGSRQRVALTDEQGRFYGLVVVAEAHAEGFDDAMPVMSIAHDNDQALLASMSIKEAMAVFDETESDTLAVLDDLQHRKLLGTLKEAYATRRYAEEMEKAHGVRL